MCAGMSGTVCVTFGVSVCKHLHACVYWGREKEGVGEKEREREGERGREIERERGGDGGG